MEYPTTVTSTSKAQYPVKDYSPAEELDEVRVALRGMKESNLSELAAVVMLSADRESAYHDWLLEELQRRGISYSPLAGCIELMQTLLVAASIREIQFQPEVDGCIDGNIGSILIGWISIDEEEYTPLYRDLVSLEARVPKPCPTFTEDQAKAWITAQWETTKGRLLGRNT